jgi:hypothetical protein
VTDPVAQAAAQIAADAAPSSTEPNLLERAMETIHTLEAKVEHLIHPETAPAVSMPANLDPNTGAAVETLSHEDAKAYLAQEAGAATAGESIPSSSASISETANTAAAGGTNQTESTGSALASGATGEAPNVVAGAVDSAAVASASIAEASPASTTITTPELSSGEAPNAAGIPPAGVATDANTAGDVGNVRGAATASSPLPNSTPFAQSAPEKSTENSALAPAATGNVLLNASPTVDVPVLEAGGAEMGELDAKASAGSPVNVANAAQTAAAALAGTAEASASTAPIATTLKTSDPLPRESHLMLLEAKISAFRTKLANAERVALVEFEAIVGHIKAVL